MGALDKPPAPGTTLSDRPRRRFPATICLQELMGRVVVDAGGRRLGRVVDCVAEPVDDELRVTALLVGAGAWRGRFGPSPEHDGQRVRWEEIAALSPRITLKRVIGNATGED